MGGIEDGGKSDAARYDTPEKRAAHAAKQREWRAKNPGRWQEIAGEARAKWKAENREAHREAQRNHRIAVRREILDLLGGQRCVKCGFDADWRALQIDHIKSDGRTDKRAGRDGLTNLWAFRNWLKRPENDAEARSMYQVLCCNCNRIKQYEAKEFPGSMVPVAPEDNLRRAKRLGLN